MFSVLLALVLAAGLVPAVSGALQPDKAHATDANDVPLTITHQPVGGTFARGGTLKMFVQASCGTSLLSYQWYRSTDAAVSSDDTKLSGQTHSMLNSSVAELQDGSTYYYYTTVKTADGTQVQTSVPAAVKIVNKGSIQSSLGNGDFENITGASTVGADYFWRNVPFWKTTHAGMSGTTNVDNIIEMSIPTTYGAPVEGHGSRVAELCAYFSSSLYQEVATVPGRIYEWSLDFTARNSTVETVAVVIGPALDGVWGGDAGFPYGKNDGCYFNQVVNKLASDKGTSVANLTQFVGKDLSTVYSGSKYYVRIVNTSTVHTWAHHAGTYTVPEGQGTSVFGFVSVNTTAPGSGNILDNITFAQGTGTAITSDVDFSGGGVLTTTKVTDPSYRYGILEMRGSTTLAAQGVRAALGDTVITPDDNGWYTPGSTGLLSFSNLTPGKTYRVVAVPKDAINAGLGTNLVPAAVLDENYYNDTTVKPASDSVDRNIQVTAEIVQGNTARAMVRPAREDVEYALLDTTPDGLKPNTANEPAKAWTPVGSGEKQLAFDGLEKGHSYALVARPRGYDEISYEQAAAGAYVIFKTPDSTFVDVSPESAKRSDDGTQLTVTNNSTSAQRYLVYDALTGEASGGWREVVAGKTCTWTGLDASKTYQIVAAEKPVGSTPSPGVRAYPAPPAPAIDYIHETVGKDGLVPSSVEFRMKDTASGTWYWGDANSWSQGSGGSPATLTAYLDDPASTGATLTYRLHADVQPAIYVEKSIYISARSAVPDQSATGYAFDYEHETIIPGSNAGAIEARASSSSAWERGTTAAPLSLSGLGWTGSQRAVQVRMSAVKDISFASRVNEKVTVPARAASPNVTLLSEDNGATYAFSGNDVASSEYRKCGTTGTWLSCSGASPEKHKTYEVRKVAAANEFASETVLRTSSLAQLQAVPDAFSDVTYGYTSTPQVKLALSNPGTNKAQVDGPAIVTMTRWPDAYTAGEGTPTPAFSVTVGETTIAPGATTSRLLSAQPNLSAGTYAANIAISFNDGDDLGDVSTYHAMCTVSLVVAKATPGPPVNMSVTEVSDTSITLAAEQAVAGDPSIEYSTAKASGYNDTSTLTNLMPQTCYGFFARTKADANHNASEPAELQACTAYAAPDPSVVKIDYAAETATYPGGYDLRASSSEAATEIASGSSITDYVGNTLSVRLAATGDEAHLDTYVPASAWATLPLPKRPSISASATSTNATDSRTPDGSLTVAGVSQFQYRKSSDTSWIGVTGSFMGSLPAGTYFVRIPATGSAFASKSIEASIGANNYFATFDLNGGTSTAALEQRVPSGHAVPEPANPTRTGYTFDGWVAEGSTTSWNFATVLTKDTVLRAHWTPNTYTVTFKPNAPVGCTASGTMDTQHRAYADAATLTSNTYTVPNWEFTGWNTQADGQGKLWVDAASGDLATDRNASITLYAQWKRPRIEASVPISATVTVSATGEFTCPNALNPDHPGAGGYGITSTTKGALKVAQIGYTLDENARDIFTSANQVMATLNHTKLEPKEQPGQSVDVPAQYFRIAPSADGITPSYLPLTLSLLYPGGTMTYKQEARTFATLAYTLAFDDAAPTPGAGA